jgi:hypothetical protein
LEFRLQSRAEDFEICSRGQLRCDGIRAETRFRLSAKRTSPFKSAGASVQSTTGSRGVRISGSSARYTMFRGSVKSTGYPLHSSVSSSLPNPCVTVCHNILTGLYQRRAAVKTAMHCRLPQYVGKLLISGATQAEQGGPCCTWLVGQSCLQNERRKSMY